MTNNAAPGNDPNLSGLTGVNRVAETHFSIRPMLVSRLKSQEITDEGRRLMNTNAQTYYDFWLQSYGDRFFDMGTFVRLGTSVETGLRDHYIALCSPPQPPPRGIFQRLVNPTDLLNLYAGCGHDLSTVPKWGRMRELMLHRHLFAHRSGLVDDEYIAKLKNLTGQDILPEVQKLNYPTEEVYWFTSLGELGEFIEDCRSFFRGLPT